MGGGRIRGRVGAWFPRPFPRSIARPIARPIPRPFARPIPRPFPQAHSRPRARGGRGEGEETSPLRWGGWTNPRPGRGVVSTPVCTADSTPDCTADSTPDCTADSTSVSAGASATEGEERARRGRGEGEERARRGRGDLAPTMGGERIRGRVGAWFPRPIARPIPRPFARTFPRQIPQAHPQPRARRPRPYDGGWTNPRPGRGVVSTPVCTDVSTPVRTDVSTPDCTPGFHARFPQAHPRPRARRGRGEGEETSPLRWGGWTNPRPGRGEAG